MHQENPAPGIATNAPRTEAATCCGPSVRSGVASERSVLLRPGVMMPDWSVVRDDSARSALSAIFELVGVGRQKWSELGVTEDRVWRTVIEQFAALGRAPVAAEIADAAGLPPDVVGDELTKLHARDVVVLDGDARITGAYPFTERPTGHKVVLRGKTLTAMCAIDALGAGAMFGADTEIASSCRYCGAAIHAETRTAGTTLAAVAPKTAVVWSGLCYADGCSATSLCTVLAFFCSDEHLAAWRAGEGAGHSGLCLSLNAALEVGKAIFMPILRPGLGKQGANLALRQRRGRFGWAAIEQAAFMDQSVELHDCNAPQPISAEDGEMALALANLAAATADPQALVRGLGRILHKTSLCIERLFVSVQALHPAFRARTYLWHLPEDRVRVIEWPHGLANRPGYFSSPDHHVHETGAELRVHNLHEIAGSPCDLYGKLRDAGCTDYLIVPLRFSDGTINTLSIATRLRVGFPERSLAGFRRLVGLLSVIFERTTAIESIDSALQTYLGRHTSAQIMRGKIRPGHGELVEAAILFADLHDFAQLSASLGPAQTVGLLNDYFDCLVEPIEENGGYVLKFIGDAVLAFFPLGMSDRPDPLAAIGKMRQRLDAANKARAAAGEPLLRHGVCLHFGTVLYGNIGSRYRLDFTIIGDAVNIASRCLADTRRLGIDYLCTDAFARKFGDERMMRIGECAVRGIAAPVVLYSLACGTDQDTSAIPR